jgi:hypothetical protein
MSEILLQAIIEKLEALELLWNVDRSTQQTPIDFSPVLAELRMLHKLLSQLSSMIEHGDRNIADVSVKIDKLIDKFSHASASNQHTTLRVKFKYLVVIAGLSALLLLFSWGWINTFINAAETQGSNWKYRYLKVSGPESTYRLMKRADSSYQADKTGFKKEVTRLEERLLSFADSIRFAGEKKGKRFTSK